MTVWYTQPTALWSLIGIDEITVSATATAQVGYTVVEPSWGQGYATEALRALLGHLLADPAIDRVVAETLEGHAASRRVMEKAGMRLRSRRVGEVDGEQAELVLYELPTGPEPTTMEELLAEQDSDIKSFKHGDVVEGKVVRIDKDEILVDIGYKSEGVIPVSELSIRRSVNPQDEVALGERRHGIGHDILDHIGERR